MDPDAILQEEIRRFREQYQRNPASLVFARLADVWRRAGEPERSLEILADGIDRHPDYVTAHLVRARALRDLGRDVEAGDSFRAALDLDAQNLVAIRGLADLAREAGDEGEELRWTEILAQVDPLNPAPRERLERLQEAVASVEDLAPSPLPVPDGAPTATRSAEAAGEEETGEAADEPTDVLDEVLEGADEIPEPDEPVDEPVDEPTDVLKEVRESADEMPEPAVEAGGSPWWFEDPDGDIEEEEDGDLVTRTMAELYLRQGLHEEAEEIYFELLKRHPDDEELLRGLEAARGMRAAKGATRPAATTDTPPSAPDDAGPPADLPAPAGPAFQDELRQLLVTGRQAAEGARHAEQPVDASPVAPSGDASPEERSPVLLAWLARLRGE
jgi:tetratricopeptide (TPR) repeat protein